MKILAFPFKRVVGHMEEQTVEGKKQFVEMVMTGSRHRLWVLQQLEEGVRLILRKGSQVH